MDPYKKRGGGKIDINGGETFSEEQPGKPLFGHKRNEEIFEELKVEPVDEELK